MSSIESGKRHKKIHAPQEREHEAILSAGANLAGLFLKSNKEKGRSLEIPKLGISISADGTITEINVTR